MQNKFSTDIRNILILFRGGPILRLTLLLNTSSKICLCLFQWHAAQPVNPISFVPWSTSRLTTWDNARTGQGHIHHCCPKNISSDKTIEMVSVKIKQHTTLHDTTSHNTTSHHTTIHHTKPSNKSWSFGSPSSFVFCKADNILHIFPILSLLPNFCHFCFKKLKK